MEQTDYAEKLEQHHLDIVKALDLDRQYILSHLRSKFILDDEDCQLIKSGASSRQKAAKFIDVLLTKGPVGYKHFIEAVEIEHPHLYKVMTGNEATYKIDSSLSEGIDSWSSFSRKELVEFDQTYLLKELKKATESNREKIYQQERFLHEKKICEQKLQVALNELKDREKVIEDLKKALETNDKKRTDNEISDNTLTHAREKEIFAKDRMIIDLQSKVIAARDYCENFRKTNEVLRRKNENLIEQVRDLTINYDFQRSQSRHLSKQVSKNYSDRKQVDEAKCELLRLRFDLTRLKEDKEDLSLRVDELTKQNIELESLCDLLRKEKSCAEENKGKFSVNITMLESKVRQLESSLQDERFKKEIHKSRNDRLLKDIESLKEQRDCYIQEREQALEERDHFANELDVCLRLKQEIQRSRDEVIQKQIKMAEMFEQKNLVLDKEIEKLSEKIEIDHDTKTEMTTAIEKKPLTRNFALPYNKLRMSSMSWEDENISLTDENDESSPMRLRSNAVSNKAFSLDNRVGRQGNKTLLDVSTSFEFIRSNSAPPDCQK